eukprot:CAMPEP_0119533624 /NCGR_PEP_ID=MMETSP1344-20130328/46986_1 /TAXON_ID=236787 /ORGANISM="Florenciella parvula, Strain CCMP2471" /LENGTH=49 /DNA_ID= /DNA_START= /DNA_END= /DNA_ORIENTATION=
MTAVEWWRQRCTRHRRRRRLVAGGWGVDLKREDSRLVADVSMDNMALDA